MSSHYGYIQWFLSLLRENEHYEGRQIDNDWKRVRVILKQYQRYYADNNNRQKKLPAKKCCRSIVGCRITHLTEGDLLGSRKNLSIQKFDTHSFSNGFAFVLHVHFSLSLSLLFFYPSHSFSVRWIVFCFELWKNLKICFTISWDRTNFHFHWTNGR